MLVKIIHGSGKVYTLPASQVVIHTDDGEPVALAFEKAGFIVYSSASENSFHKVCTDNGIRAIDAKSKDG
jgi:hypothetical protein